MMYHVMSRVAGETWQASKEERSLTERLLAMTDNRLLRDDSEMDRLNELITREVAAHNRGGERARRLRVGMYETVLLYRGRWETRRGICVAYEDRSSGFFSCHLRPLEGFMFPEKQEGGVQR